MYENYITCNRKIQFHEIPFVKNELFLNYYAHMHAI